MCFDINSNSNFQNNQVLTQTKIKPKLREREREWERERESTCNEELKKYYTKTYEFKIEFLKYNGLLI